MESQPVPARPERLMRQRLVPYLLVAPSLVLIAALLMGLYSVLGWSLSDGTDEGLSLAQYESLATNPSYRSFFTSSLWLAAVSTAVALVLGFPAAYYMEIKASPRQRKFIFAALLAMFLTPVATSFEAAMAVVVLRRKLTLITRRQVARVLRIVGIRASRVVLMRTVVLTIVPVIVSRPRVVVARTLRLEDPDAVSPLRMGLQAHAQTDTEQNKQ